jgi:hypothetical protein
MHERLISINLILAVLTGICAVGIACGQVKLGGAGKLKLLIDFRFRLERDYDSQQPDGTPRADRDRARIRARTGLTYNPSPLLSFGVRARTGSINSQQSPHITIHDFTGNPTGDKDVVLDQWYMKWSRQRWTGWLGRNEFPFWKQDELFWDDDVTPVGMALRYNTKKDKANFTINAGYLYLPDGMHDFHGDLIGAQLVFAREIVKAEFTAAGGLFVFDGKPGAKHLRNGNGSRDYIICVGNLQSKWQVEGRPLILGFDLTHNSENYSATDSDPFTSNNYKQIDSYVFYVRFGQLQRKGDWLLGYYYGYIATLAVVASYAQDDWVRFGSADQTDASDFKGYELRAAYSLLKTVNLVLRFYDVKAITSSQDGKRLRLDFDMKF